MAGWRNHDLRLFRQVWNQLKAGDISLGDRAYGSSGIESPPSSVMCYTPQALSALKLTPAANASMNVCFQVATGAVCHIEYTPTFSPAQWQTLGSATADANGKVMLTDSLTGNSPTRFYRAAVP
jgi:hypothetical protein